MRENKQVTNGGRKRYKTIVKLKYRDFCVFYKYTQYHINSLLLCGRTKPENKKGYNTVLYIVIYSNITLRKKRANSIGQGQ